MLKRNPSYISVFFTLDTYMFKLYCGYTYTRHPLQLDGALGNKIKHYHSPVHVCIVVLNRPHI